VTPKRLARLRTADEILVAELANAALLVVKVEGENIRGTAQAFTVLLPVRSVDVMGDQRTYQEVIVLRAVTTEDFMTADWCACPRIYWLVYPTGS